MRKYIKFSVYIIFTVLVLVSCEEKDKHPEITTTEVAANSASSVIAKAKISELGNSPITDHGFIYYISTSEPPLTTIPYTSNKISLGSSVPSDSFSAQINIADIGYFSNNYKCYVRAYLTNEIGTVYANQLGVALPVLSLNSVSPQSAKVGDTITISGNNFNENPAYNSVKFNGTSAQIVAATKTYLKVKVPSGISESYYGGYIEITVTSAGKTLEINSIFRLLPSPTSFSPTTGTWYSDIYIYGTGLYQTAVYFDDYLISNSYSYSGYISCEVPTNMTRKKFKIFVEKGGVKTEVPGGYFTMNPISVTSFSPSSIMTGSELTVYGQNFHPYTEYNTLFIGSTKVTASYRNSSYLRFTIPSSLQPGEYPFSITNSLDTVNISGNLRIFVPSITGLNPTSGYVGSNLTIDGHNLGSSASYSTYIYFNSSSFYYFISDTTHVVIQVPSLTPGTYKISMNINSTRVYSPVDFTVLAPTLSTISPTSGTVGTAVVLSGTGFGTSTGSVVVKFGNINATILSVTDNQINAKVPSGVSTGTWSVTATVNGYTIANSVTFNIP